MCLIAIAGAGTNKYNKEFLQSLRVASTTNKDGIGFAFKRHSTKRVYISKGYKDIDEVIKHIEGKKLKTNDELVVHLRIGNRGSVNVDMCHPFVLADNATDILANKTYVNLPIMAHNGTFFGYGNTSNFSDTFMFIQDMMYHPLMIEILKTDKDFFEKAFKDTLKTNKLAFLFPNCNKSLETIGNFIDHDGYLYSNRSFESYTYRNVGGEEYDNFDDYYTDKFGKSYYGHNNIRQLAPKATREIDDDDDINDNYSIPKKVESGILNVDLLCKVREHNKTTDTRWGYRKAEDKTEISVEHLKRNRPAFSNYLDIKYYEHMGLYIPECFIKSDTQFEHIQIKPTAFNYNDLRLKCIKGDSEYGVERSSYYRILSVGDDEEYFVLAKIFSNNNSKVKFLSVPALYMNDLFICTPAANKLSKYKQYYWLVRDVSISSTKLLSTIKFIKDSEEYAKNLVFSVFGVAGIRREALDLFKYNLALVTRQKGDPISFINNRMMY